MNTDKREITFLLLVILAFFATAEAWKEKLSTMPALMSGRIITLLVLATCIASVIRLCRNFIPKGHRVPMVFIPSMALAFNAAFIWLSQQQVETKQRLVLVVLIAFAAFSTALVMMLADDLKWRSPGLPRFTATLSGGVVALVGTLGLIHNATLAAGLALIASTMAWILSRRRLVVG